MALDENGPGSEFVRRHHVHYDIRDELIIDGEERRKIGYRVRLWGVLPKGGILPADAAESPLAQELVALAEQVVPEVRDGWVVRIEPPAPALYDSSVVAGADEIALDLQLRHGELGDVPPGPAEDRCLKTIKKALDQLGAVQRD